MTRPPLTHRPTLLLTRVATLALLAAATSLSLSEARAQAPSSEATSALPSAEVVKIKTINVRSVGAGAIDKNRVLDNMSLKVGSGYTQDKSDADVKNLISRGVVSNVSIAPEADADGVRLTVIVEPRTNIAEVNFLGNSAISSKKLLDISELSIGGIVDEATLRTAQAEIEKEYREKGFSDVRISYRQEKAAETGFTRVIFNINEGGKNVVDDIEFQGNTVFSSGDLESAVKIGERDWWKVWDLSKKVNNEQLDRDVAALELKYQDAGYMNAKVTGVDRVPNGEKVNVLFKINEGQKFDVTAVGIDGMSTFSKDDLLPSLELEAGKPYSGTKIKKDIKLIRDYYGARGYADVGILPRINRSGTNQVSVAYNVTESQKSYIRRINIDGNNRTKDEVIRRELAINPGEEYSTTKIDISQKRLQNLGYFGNPSSGDPGVEFFPTETDTAGYKDINITVRERQTGAANLGAGFSSNDSLVGFLEVTQSNFDLFNYPFAGAGQKFRFRVQVGTRRKDAELEFTEPWLFGERLSFGTELYYREQNYFSDVYDQRNIGGALSLTKPIGEDSRLKFEYRLQQVEIYDLDEDVSEIIRNEEGDYLQSKFGLSFNYDTRDSLLGITRSGRKVQLLTGVSGLGGDVETYNFGINAAQYVSLPFDTVFKMQGSFSSVDNWGGDRVPIFDREFLGGSNDLRGFKYREVGPKDEDGEPIGGKTSTFVSAEYNFPILKTLRGVVFADLGQVSPDTFDLGGDWNSDVGLGVHVYFLPQFPFQIEVGFPISSDAFNDDGPRVNFNAGYRF